MTLAARRDRAAGSPFRQQRSPRTVGQLSASNVGAIAGIVQARVASVARARGCCCYVFVRLGRVYVLSEDHVLAHSWAVQHAEEWVGCYGGTPDLAPLTDDLRMMLPVR